MIGQMDDRPPRVVTKRGEPQRVGFSDAFVRTGRNGAKRSAALKQQDFVIELPSCHCHPDATKPKATGPSLTSTARELPADSFLFSYPCQYFCLTDSL
jgi:hypothetical protein